jgi:hypothetical protein
MDDNTREMMERTEDQEAAMREMLQEAQAAKRGAAAFMNAGSSKRSASLEARPGHAMNHAGNHAANHSGSANGQTRAASLDAAYRTDGGGSNFSSGMAGGGTAGVMRRSTRSHSADGNAGNYSKTFNERAQIMMS